MNGLMNVVYPVNNDRRCHSHIYIRDYLGVKDADGNVILNVNRYSFAGRDGRERRMRAIAFASALVDLLNSHMERRESK
jgi:hypothetical protein